MTGRNECIRTYTVRTSFTVPAGTKARLKERAKAEGISLSELVRRSLRDMCPPVEESDAR